MRMDVRAAAAGGHLTLLDHQLSARDVPTSELEAALAAAVAARSWESVSFLAGHLAARDRPMHLDAPDGKATSAPSHSIRIIGRPAYRSVPLSELPGLCPLAAFSPGLPDRLSVMVLGRALDTTREAAAADICAALTEQLPPHRMDGTFLRGLCRRGDILLGGGEEVRPAFDVCLGEHEPF